MVVPPPPLHRALLQSDRPQYSVEGREGRVGPWTWTEGGGEGGESVERRRVDTSKKTFDQYSIT